MRNPIEILTEKINTDKEVLSVMPQNTKKNRQAYAKKVEELKDEYQRSLNDIITEIKRRANKVKNVRQNPEIKKTLETLEKFEELDLYEDLNTTYEKIKLDEKIFLLRRFYKNNLEKVNENIEECLKKFEDLGVQLKESDFKYSPHLRIYMKDFLEKSKSMKSNSAIMKEAFEKVYWECPDIIVHIEINLRYLYLKYQKELEKKFRSENKKVLKELGTSEKTILGDYSALILKMEEIESIDKQLWLENFLNKSKDPKNFEEASILKQYDKMVVKPVIDYSKTELNELKDNLVKLSQSLTEYTKYLKYKFIVDKVIEIYNEKDKHKNNYETQKKNIQKLESKLFSANKKYEKLDKKKDSIFKKKKAPDKLKQLASDINAQILELKELYRQLDMDKVNDKIASTLTDNSTIYEVFLLASAYYTFLVEILMDKYPEMSEDELNAEVAEIRRFVTYPYITILKNINIKEEKNIALMIKDKYNLLDLNVNKPDFEEDGIDNLITNVKAVEDAYNFEKSKLSIEDIEYLLKANKLLENIGEQNDGDV
ncbi:MAG: hypothetical protein HUJ68_13980 [Clostridia bacterium]|nr:hypothetical protein [Clostridia bacterium]